MLAKAYGKSAPTTVADKKSLLDEIGVALWDMVVECEIEGSLDSNIRDYVVADLKKVVDNSKIEKIVLNGGMSAKLFFKHFPEYADMAISLPSTSPANARFDESAWLNALAN